VYRESRTRESVAILHATGNNATAKLVMCDLITSPLVTTFRMPTSFYR
jgi:hypothetical protein